MYASLAIARVSCESGTLGLEAEATAGVPATGWAASSAAGLQATRALAPTRASKAAAVDTGRLHRAPGGRGSGARKDERRVFMWREVRSGTRQAQGSARARCRIPGVGSAKAVRQPHRWSDPHDRTSDPYALPWPPRWSYCQEPVPALRAPEQQASVAPSSGTGTAGECRGLLCRRGPGSRRRAVLEEERRWQDPRHGRQLHPRRVGHIHAAATRPGDGAFGTIKHRRAPAPVEEQLVIRLNRDTIYSSALFDLDAGPVTLTSLRVASASCRLW